MFAISSLRSLTGAFLIGALLAGCGGGGASTAGSVPAGPGLGASSALKIHLDVPLTKSGAANRRKPQYVSASTQSFAVTVGANPPVNVNVSSISPACTLNTAITETNTNSTQPNQLTKVADGTVWYGLQSGQAIKQILAGGAPGNNVSTYDASNPMYYDSITSIGPDVDGSLWTGHFDTGVYTVGHVTGGNSYTPVSMGNFGSYFATSFASGAAAGDEYFTYEDSTPTLQPHLGHIAAGAVDALPHGSLSGNAIRVKAGSGRVWFNEDNGSVGYMLTDGTYTTHEFTPSGTGAISYPAGIAVAPDNSLYFVKVSGAQPSIGHVDSTGSFLPTISLPASLNNAQINGLAIGPDGAIWIASITSGLFRVTTGGVTTGPYSTPLGGASPGIYDVAVGGDNAVYFTEYTPSPAYYGRVALSYSCSTTIAAPSGSTTVSIKAYDGQNGTGTLLSQVLNVPVTINPNGVNILTFVLNGVVDHVNLTATPQNLHLGCAGPFSGSTTIGAQAVDADGNFIVPGSAGMMDASGNPLQIQLSTTDSSQTGAGDSFSPATLSWPSSPTSTFAVNTNSFNVTVNGAASGAPPAIVPHGINSVAVQVASAC